MVEVKIKVGLLKKDTFSLQIGKIVNSLQQELRCNTFDVALMF